MGKIYDSLLSGSSGRTGRVVIANINGHEISRIRPRKRTKTPTEKQQLVRDCMKVCVDFMVSYRAFACKHYGYRTGMRSCYNQAFTNLTTSFGIDYTTFSIVPDYAKIAFAKGGLLAVIPTSIAIPTPNTIEITWQNNAGSNPDRETDMLQILVAFENEINTNFIENAAPRLDETYTLNLTNYQLGKVLHFWIAFRAIDELSVSNSIYLGSITT